MNEQLSRKSVDNIHANLRFHSDDTTASLGSHPAPADPVPLVTGATNDDRHFPFKVLIYKLLLSLPKNMPTASFFVTDDNTRLTPWVSHDIVKARRRRGGGISGVRKEVKRASSQREHASTDVTVRVFGRNVEGGCL